MRSKQEFYEALRNAVLVATKSSPISVIANHKAVVIGCKLYEEDRANAEAQIAMLRADLEATKATIAELREELLFCAVDFECAVARVRAGPGPHLVSWDHPYDRIRAVPVLRHFEKEARRIRLVVARTEPKSEGGAK